MKKRMICLLLLLAATLFIVAGCSWVENLQLFKNDKAGEEQQPQEAEPDASATLENDLSITGADPAAGDPAGAAAPKDAAPEAQEAPEAQTAPSVDTRRVTLYFASADGSTLEPETRDIPKQEGIARATVNQLIAGPQDANLSPTLPAAAILEDIDISNGVCTVDFSSELVENLEQDTQKQLLALYSIVNTLSQFDTVDYVKILIDGRTLDTSIGGVDVSAALAPVASF